MKANKRHIILTTNKWKEVRTMKCPFSLVEGKNPATENCLTEVKHQISMKLLITWKTQAMKRDLIGLLNDAQ